MKLYSTYVKADMSMAGKDALAEALSDVVQKEKIKYVLETGTYLGLGSTQTIAKAFSQPPMRFITIEANRTSWEKARKNLAQFPFVTPLWGKSVTEAEAVAFIRGDQAIEKHEAYPDIWIDDIENPQKFYTDEIQGKLGQNPAELTLTKRLTAPFLSAGKDLLRKYLREFKEQKPLIVLDSAGGIGYLEFLITKEVMGNSPYILLLDDIHHLKHFRSLRDVQTNKSFKILTLNLEDGWVLAKHN